MVSTRNEFEKYLQKETFDLIKLYGEAINITRDPGLRLKKYNEYEEKMVSLFNAVFSTPAEILDGEFGFGERNAKVPLFVFLDFIYSMTNNFRSILDSKNLNFCESVVEFARYLNFSKEFNKSWHINDEIFNEITNGEVVAVLEQFEDSRAGMAYNSTTYNFFKFHAQYGTNLEKDYDRLLNQDVDSYPLLATSKIWQIKFQSSSEYINNISQSIPSAEHVLFKEQKEKLKSDYKRLAFCYRDKQREYLISSIKKYILPLYANQTLEHFSLNSELPWDEEDFKELAEILESIFLKYESYKAHYPNKTFNKCIENKTFVEYIKNEVTEALDIETKIKARFVEDINNSYQEGKKQKDITSSDVISKLEKLNLVELHSCIKQSQKKSGKSYIRRFVEES